jgi:Na+/H+ antiporter NhaC
LALLVTSLGLYLIVEFLDKGSNLDWIVFLEFAGVLIGLAVLLALMTGMIAWHRWPRTHIKRETALKFEPPKYYVH